MTRATLTGLVLSCFFVGSAAAEPRLLWGDTHVHTSDSADAFFMGNLTATPEVAYRFAKGEPVIHPYTRDIVQMESPLDFIVVADHAESMGVFKEYYYNGAQLQGEGFGQRLKAWLIEKAVRFVVDQQYLDAIMTILSPETEDPVVAAAKMQSKEGIDFPGGKELVKKTWLQQIDTADRYYDPGVFTTFIGWEWSPAPGASNMHRVIFTDVDQEIARNFIPFSSRANSPYPEDLWDWLEKTGEEIGADFVAIPHNSNLSKGFMFGLKTLRGEPMSIEHMNKRKRWEPVVEITQIKGDSETHPTFSPQDEFANFETYSYTNDLVNSYPRTEFLAGSYVRPGLKQGLLVESESGVNPFQFGVVGSSDTHMGLVTTDDSAFTGKYALDSVPEGKDRPEDNPVGVSGWNMSGAGLAGVWAEDNTREAIFAAFKRREVFATSGPRIAVKFYSGWEIPESVLQNTTVNADLRKYAVPMGSEIHVAKNKRSPKFVVLAARDPRGANLDRIQIVKGWIDSSQVLHEKVFDVAWSDSREVDSSGRLPPLLDTVDRQTGRYTDEYGASMLSAVWRDPDFNASQSAFYYARVLQVPTARHSLYGSVALGREADAGGPATIQERAYSSPIWVRPETREEGDVVKAVE